MTSTPDGSEASRPTGNAGSAAGERAPFQRLTRRQLLAVGSVTGLGALLAACGGASAPATSAPAAATTSAGSAATAPAATMASGPATAVASPGTASAASTAPSGASSPAVAGGGRLVIGANIDDIITFDPGIHYEVTSQQVMGAIYESLVGQYPPDLNTFVPVLAQEVPTVANGGVSADGTVYTFKLREGVKFHSGNPMTAADVVFSFKRLAYMKKNPSFLTDPFTTNDTVGVEAVDPLTVRFTLTGPNVAFLAYLATTNTVVIDSKTVTAKGGLDTPAAKDGDKAKEFLDSTSAGTGPYKLTSFKLKEEVTIERNAAYWRQPAAFDQIVLKYIKDSGTALQQLQAGSIDIAQGLDADAIAGLKGNNALTVVEGNSLNLGYLALNNDPTVGDVVSKKEVRQAIGYSIDYDGIIKGLRKGAAVQPATVIPLGLLSADKAQQFAYKTDVAKAQGLIKGAGADGKTVKLTYGAGSTLSNIQSDTLAAKLKADIERCGIKVDLAPMEPQQRLADFRAAKLQSTFSGWSPDYVDVHTYAEPFGSSSGVAAKRVKYSNPKVDDLLKQGITETDPSKRAAIYLELQKTMVDDAAFLVLLQDVFQVAMKKNVTGYQIHPIFLVNLYALKRA